MVDDLPKTISVPEAGKAYFDLSRNGAYAAAKRGDIKRTSTSVAMPAPQIEPPVGILRFCPRGNLAHLQKLREARADPTDFDAAIEDAPACPVAVLVGAAGEGGHTLMIP